MHIKLIFTTKVLHLASFWKWEFWNSERYIVINTRRIFRGWGTCDITGTLKMHICKWSGSAKTPCYILGRSDIPEFCWRMWTQVFECVKQAKSLLVLFSFVWELPTKRSPVSCLNRVAPCAYLTWNCMCELFSKMKLWSSWNRKPNIPNEDSNL